MMPTKKLRRYRPPKIPALDARTVKASSYEEAKTKLIQNKIARALQKCLAIKRKRIAAELKDMTPAERWRLRHYVTLARIGFFNIFAAPGERCVAANNDLEIEEFFLRLLEE